MKKYNMKALSLLSSGIDSPVSSYLMKKQNIEIIAIHFDNQPLTSGVNVEKVKKLCNKLGIKKLYIITHGKNQIALMKSNVTRYRCILCRRLMFKIAEKIAKKEKCSFLVTGENLGQVASQTLSNLTNCDRAIKTKIIRPLISYDKEEIIKIAKKIGTYDISIESELCCNAVPKYPKTRSNIKDIGREESKLDIKKIIDDSVKNCKIVAV